MAGIPYYIFVIVTHHLKLMLTHTLLFLCFQSLYCFDYICSRMNVLLQISLFITVIAVALCVPHVPDNPKLQEIRKLHKLRKKCAGGGGGII